MTPGIGYGTELIVGESIKIGRNVMIANRVSLIGFRWAPTRSVRSCAQRTAGSGRHRFHYSQGLRLDWQRFNDHEGSDRRPRRGRCGALGRENERRGSHRRLGQPGQGRLAGRSARRMVETLTLRGLAAPCTIRRITLDRIEGRNGDRPACLPAAQDGRGNQHKPSRIR